MVRFGYSMHGKVTESLNLFFPDFLMEELKKVIFGNFSTSKKRMLLKSSSLILTSVFMDDTSAERSKTASLKSGFEEVALASNF